MGLIIIHSDGAARGNPGPAGAGALLTNEKGEKVAEVSRYLGETTNNQAEYRALLLALEEALKHGATSFKIFCDSELLVKQVLGEYRVKNSDIKPLYSSIMIILHRIKHYDISHVPREKNKLADKLANKAIDEELF